MKEHTRFDPIENFYFSRGFEPISVYCSSADVHVSDDSNDYLPQCQDCEKEGIRRPQKKI